MCPTLQEAHDEKVNAAGGFPGQPQRKYDPYSNPIQVGRIIQILAMGIHKWIILCLECFYIMLHQNLHMFLTQVSF